MKKLFFGLALLAFVGCGQKKWTKEDAKKKCIADANKDNESKDIPDDLKNKICDCWADKAIVNYKSAAAADKDSSSTAFKEMGFSCMWNKEIVGPMFRNEFKGKAELEGLGDANINKIADCAAEKVIARFKSLAELQKSEDAWVKIGEDCSTEVIWNKGTLKMMILEQFKKEENMQAVEIGAQNKIADCVADKMLSNYKSFSEAKMNESETEELSKSCVLEVLGESGGE